jgi:hypothetical protein
MNKNFWKSNWSYLSLYFGYDYEFVEKTFLIHEKKSPINLDLSYSSISSKSSESSFD